MRGRAEQIVAGEKGYFKLSSVVLQNVPVKYGACYYYACGEQVGTRGRLCLRELDEDGRGIHNVWTGSRRRLGLTFSACIHVYFESFLCLPSYCSVGGWSLSTRRLVGKLIRCHAMCMQYTCKGWRMSRVWQWSCQDREFVFARGVLR